MNTNGYDQTAMRLTPGRLDRIEQEIPFFDDKELLAQNEQIRQFPQNDDMTVLDLVWMGTSSAEEDAL
jgi:hypothetical protein